MKKNPRLSTHDLESFNNAQLAARRMAEEIISQLSVGMTEADAYEIAHSIFRAHGIRHHWHVPVIGVGPGSTKLKSFSHYLASSFTRKNRIIETSDLVYVDIAPFIDDYPSDYTITSLFGEDTELAQLIAFTKQLSIRTANYARGNMLACEVLSWMEEQIQEADRPYELIYPPLISVAHRIGRVPLSWPQIPEVTTLAYLSLKTVGSFMNSRNQLPMLGLWTIEPSLIYRGRAAKFEQLVYFDEDKTVLLGDDLVVNVS